MTTYELLKEHAEKLREIENKLDGILMSFETDMENFLDEHSKVVEEIAIESGAVIGVLDDDYELAIFTWVVEQDINELTERVKAKLNK